MDPFEYIQSWYRDQVNGEWEHTSGVTIESLDNPGWMVSIDLIGTPLEDREMAAVREERSESDWITCEVDHNQFRGGGDAAKLGLLLEVFRTWAMESAAVK